MSNHPSPWVKPEDIKVLLSAFIIKLGREPSFPNISAQ